MDNQKKMTDYPPPYSQVVGPSGVRASAPKWPLN